MQFCLCAPFVFIPVMSHPPNTKTSSGDGNFSGPVLFILTKGLFLVPCFPLPLLSSSLLLLSWLRAGLLLAGRRHEVVWEQFLADRIHELVIKRSPDTFFCSPQSRLLSRSLLPCVCDNTHAQQSGKGGAFGLLSFEKRKKVEIFD